MVALDIFYEVYERKVKRPLLEIKENKVNIGNFINRVSNWFDKFRKNDVGSEDFRGFLEYFQREVLEMLPDIRETVRYQILDNINFFFEEIEEHCSEEIVDEIENVIAKLGGRKRRGTMQFIYRWSKSLMIVAIIILVLAGVYMVMPLMSSDAGNDVLDEELDVIVPLESEKEVLDIGVDVEMSEYENNNEQAEDVKLSEFELSEIEKGVLQMINDKRETYYQEKLTLDINYSKMLDNNTKDIAKVLNIDLFIFEYDDSLNVHDANVSQGIFDQMSQNNLYDPEYTRIALTVEEEAYKLYHVYLALY